MQPTDKELLIACRHGHQSSWEALVDRYQRLVYAIPRRAGLNEDLSSDVFQEVFTTLLQKLNDINEPERLHAWLVTTARRKTWRLLSKQRTAGGDVGEDAMLTIADDARLPDEALERFEEQQRIRAALLLLDERCQRLLTMLYYHAEPPSYAAIAEALGMSEGSVGPTRARCLKKMLEVLENGRRSIFAVRRGTV